MNCTHHDTPVALWSADLSRPPTGPPLVAGDLLLVPTQEPGPSPQHATLHALGLDDGRQRWQRSFEYAMVSGVATRRPSEVSETPEGLALVAITSLDLIRGEGALVALDTAGEERWRWAPSVQRVSAPALTRSDDFSRSGQGAPEVATTNSIHDLGDVVCVTADARTLVLLDLATGEEQARTALKANASLSAPALVESVAYVPCRSPHLLAVGLDGRMRWHFTAEDGPDAWLNKTPIVVGEHLFAVLSIGAVLALGTEDGSLAWRADVGPAGKPLSPPTTDGQRLFVGARDGLHALDPSDGHELWDFPTERRITPAPLVAGGTVYVVCHDHRLYALDAATGRELWRYEVERRIEVSPALAACGEPLTPCVLIADRGGTLTAVARPLSAAEHEAAGHWVEAASIYADLGQLTRGAQLLEDHTEPLKAGELWEAAGERERAAAQYEAAEHWVDAASAYAAVGQLARGAQLLQDHDEPLKAAELWKAAGERERAAAQYETAGAWQQAVELWAGLGRPLRQAEVLEAHARSLEDGPCSEEERAEAWAAAAEAFDAEGERERATACWREAARCLRQPVITLDVQLDKGLVLRAWSRLQFVVRNDGYGPARNLTIRASGDEFEGQVMKTRQITTLWAGRERIERLDIRPLEHGETVPLRVSVEYQDQAGELQSRDHTIHIAVARTGVTRGAGETIGVFGSGKGAEQQRERELASLRRQLEEAEKNLRLIEERKTQYVLEVDVPLQLIKEERSLRERIGELERELNGLETRRPPLPATTHVLTFDRLSPVDFERLCLWLVEREGYARAEHLGLAGSEQGRDVVAYRPIPRGEELWYFQCKRYRSINAKTLKDEVDKYLQLAQEKPHLRPAGVVFVVSCAVSAKVREEVGAYCEQHGLAHEFWALTELDMRVKQYPDLLQEFFSLAP